MAEYDYQTFRVIYEITSTILCLILVRFMIKPYQFTKESRYLGLPLGFGFLGATYALAALLFYQPFLFGNVTIYLQLILRSFAFVFLVVTYYFSRQTSENSRKLWNSTIAIIISAFLTFLLLIIIPDITLLNYQLVSSFTRIFNLICIIYICAHTLRSHIEKPDPETIWIPFGYIFLAISQFLLIIYAIDDSMSAWWSALGIRWVALAIFLIISYQSFYGKRRGLNEKNRS
jgi:hypothetical protein